jgi:hypothetical protein
MARKGGSQTHSQVFVGNAQPIRSVAAGMNAAISAGLIDEDVVTIDRLDNPQFVEVTARCTSYQFGVLVGFIFGHARGSINLAE